MHRLSIGHLHNYSRIYMSQKILTNIDFNRYDNSYPSLKPKGLWYSNNTEWLEWVRSEMPHWEYPYLYSITLDGNILRIEDFESLLNFTEIYNISNLAKFKQVDWEKVINDYDGIEFLNYQNIKNEMRSYLSLAHSLSWFLTLDISGGCIWNKSGLESFILIDENC